MWSQSNNGRHSGDVIFCIQSFPLIHVYLQLASKVVHSLLN